MQQTKRAEFDDRYFTIKAALLQCIEKLKIPYETSPSSDEKRGSKNLAQILEQQTIGSSGGDALSSIGATKSNVRAISTKPGTTD